MKKTLFKLSLAALAVVLLGSCEKINQRIDALEGRIDGIENEKIATISSQIASINASIADLGTIRSDISELQSLTDYQSIDIFNLEEACMALEDRIVLLEEYVDFALEDYAKKDWVEMTFSTLEQYEATCDTIAKIDARIGSLDEKLSKDIKDCVDSMKRWVNVQFEAYYTAAEMDAALEMMQADIDSAKAAGKITDERVDSLANELTKTKAAVDTAKANIRAEYKAAIETAIKTSEGKLTKALNDAITEVNGKITSLATRVSTLESSVATLTGRVSALESMIQAITIVPAYSDGSVKAINGSLELNLIVSPSSAAKGLTKDNVKILLNKVATKAVSVDTVKTDKITSFKVDQTKGIVEIQANISDRLSALQPGQLLTVAANVKNGISNFTTEFVNVDNTPGYTVTFNNNYGATPVTRDTSVLKGGKINKPADPTRDGYFFDKWFTKKYNSSEKEVDWNFGTMTVSQDTTLYAEWIKGAKVTFRKDTVNLTVCKDTIVRPNSTVNKPAVDPDSTGYVFKGWYTRKSDGSFDKEWDFGTNVTADTTLFAKWAKVMTVAQLVATNSKFPVSNSDDVIPKNVWINANNDSCYFVTGEHIKFMNKTRGGSTAVIYSSDHKLTRQDDGSYLNESGKLKFIMASDRDSVVKITLNTSPITTFNGDYTPQLLPAGALPGEFSVSATKKVHFSQGNLVATIDATGTPIAWKFAANQYEYIGNATANTSIGKIAGYIDLFGWSTDAASNNWGIHTKDEATTGYTDGTFKDWGKNIGDSNTWRTLTKSEWEYLLKYRTASTVNGQAKARYAKATVNNKAGVILLPDTYAHPVGVTALTNINEKDGIASYTANTYDLTDWAKMESAGAVFLPAAGKRSGSNVEYVGGCGYYWSSTAENTNRAFIVNFESSSAVTPYDSNMCGKGCSVRLITEVK